MRLVLVPALVAVVLLSGAGCRLLGLAALSCDVAGDCPGEHACEEGVCVPVGAPIDDPDAGPGGDDAGSDPGDGGPDPDDAGPSDAGPEPDGGPIVPDNCDGPGALRDELDTLVNLDVEEFSGATAQIVDSALELNVPAGGELDIETVGYAHLTEDGFVIEVKSNNPPPDDAYFRFSIMASAVDEPTNGDDRIGFFWQGDELRVTYGIGPVTDTIGTHSPYDRVALPRWRIRRSGGEAVLDALPPGEVDGGVEIARWPLPPQLYIAQIEFMADGGASGFAVSFDAINPHVPAKPFCPASTFSDPLDDTAWEPGLEVATQEGLCTVAEAGGALAFEIEPTDIDAECEIQSRLSYDLRDDAITVRLAAGPWFERRDTGGAYAFSFGVRVTINDNEYFECGWDGPTVFTWGTFTDYQNSPNAYDLLIPRLRVGAIEGQYACEVLADDDTVVYGTTSALPFTVDRVRPSLFFLSFDQVTDTSALTMTIEPAP